MTFSKKSKQKICQRISKNNKKNKNDKKTKKKLIGGRRIIGPYYNNSFIDIIVKRDNVRPELKKHTFIAFKKNLNTIIYGNKIEDILNTPNINDEIKKREKETQ